MMYSDALERKLQPIYDAIDTRNYKNALKHTDAALKKYPGNQLLSALRAFALQRTSKSDEALALLQSIVDKGPESERVLHTMSFTYRAAGKPEVIATAYAVAAEKHPQDLEILKGLFGAYAKELNFVKQQQIALKLAKLVPEEADTYTWWAIVSLALQARAAVLSTPPGANAEQLMKLAETMIARQMRKGKGALPSFEALLLYTDILQGQGKATEAAAAIRETTGTAGGLKEDSRQLLAAALVRSGDVSAAAELYKEAFVENTDDWWSWNLFLSCTVPSSATHSLELNTPGIAFPVGIVGGLAEAWDSKHLEEVWQSSAAKQEGGLESVAQKEADADADTVVNAIEAIETAVNTRKGFGKGQSRGAALAPLELACRMYRLGLYTMRMLSEAIASALPTFCHSFSCAIDMRRYISHIDSREERDWLAERASQIFEATAKSFEEKFKSNSSDESSSNDSTANSNNKLAIKALWCRTNALALQQELLGCPGNVPSPAAVNYAVELLDLFSSNLGLSESLDPKDRGHGEDLVALAAAALVSAASKSTPSSQETTSESPLLLLTACLALEAAQIRRTVAAPLRLSACGIYALLNAPKKAMAQLTALDVKSILHESMTGHWALPALLSSASPDADFEPWLSGISNVHVDQVLEASESMFTAYEQGTYSKVPEFVDFWETLGKSHTRWSGAAEQAILKLRGSFSGGSGGSNSSTAGAAGLAAAAHAMSKKSVGTVGVETRPGVDKIRFNDDLSTRPAWFPPAAVDTRLAIAAWWEREYGEEGGAAVPAASREMWWGVTGAGERKVPQSEQWRQAQRHGLARRQALPELLAGVLQPATLNEEEREALLNLVNTAWAPETYPLVNNNSKLISSPLDVSKALFSAGLAVHAALNAAEADAAAAVTACDAACTILDQFKQQFSTCLFNSFALLLEDNDGNACLPLPGNAGPALSAALLSEEALWSAACLPTWAKLIRTKYPSSGDDDANASTTLKTKLQNAVHDAGNGIYSALLAVKNQTSTTSIATPKATASEILNKIESTWPQASKLWKYESKFNAAKALEEVFTEQLAFFKRMHQLATQAIISLKQFHS